MNMPDRPQHLIGKAILSVVLAAATLTAGAQSGTNSPYSQYGLGTMSDQTSGFNRGMNGLGLGFHEHNQINYLNPASYSALDSLTFIFDIGMTGQITNFKEGNTKINARNADFEYAVAGFRAFRHLGVSFGIIPFTNVGYDYTIGDYLNDDYSEYYTTQYSAASGGVHQIYFGMGWEPFRRLSIGANISYLWGDYERCIENEYSDSWVNTLSKYYIASINSYKLDFGIQYTVPLNKRNEVTIGVTYSPGHHLGCDPECLVISDNTSTGASDTTSYSIDNGLEIPMMLGVGFMWNHDNKLKFGIDYSLQKWGDTESPEFVVINDVPYYRLTDDFYSDRHKFTVGGEYCKNEYSRDWIDRLRFRAGASYATSYYKINGQDGPSEISVSAGFGIPIINNYNNRSMLNVSAQWVHYSGDGMITENTFRINIGITFNERWFSKWRVE